jgi:hypothetical protein
MAQQDCEMLKKQHEQIIKEAKNAEIALREKYSYTNLPGGVSDVEGEYKAKMALKRQYEPMIHNSFKKYEECVSKRSQGWLKDYHSNSNRGVNAESSLSSYPEQAAQVLENAANKTKCPERAAFLRQMAKQTRNGTAPSVLNVPQCPADELVTAGGNNSQSETALPQRGSPAHANNQDLVFETPEYKARKAQENAAIITNGLVDALGNVQGRQESRDRFNNGLANTRDKVAGVNNQGNNTAQPRDNRGIMQTGQANNQSSLGEPGTESDDEDNSPSPLTAFKEPAERKIEGWFDETIGDRIGIKGEEVAERINKLEEHWGRGKKLLNGEFSPDDVADYFPESENALVKKIQNESRDGIINTANATIQGANFLRNSVDSDGVMNWNEQEAERQIYNMNPLNHVPIISDAVALSQGAVEFYQKWGSQLSDGKVKQITKDIIGGGLIGGALALSPPLGFVFGAAWYISRKP